MMEIAERAGLIFLWTGGIAGVALGAAMLLSPQGAGRANEVLSKWVDTDPMHQAIDKPRWTERLLYRHHRILGLLLLVGAGFILKTFMFGNGLRALTATVSIDAEILIEAAANLFVIGSVIAALIGLILLTRPSMLKDIEQSANRWVSTEGVTRFFNHMHSSSDHFVFKHRKVVGSFLMLGGIYIVATLGYFLFLNK